MSTAASTVPFSPMTPRLGRVRRVRHESADVVTLAIEPPDGEGFPFAPGQFTMLSRFGFGEVPISISGDPGRPELLVHTIRAVGPATRALCALKAGDPVGIRGPFGSHWPVEAAAGKDLLIVTGGVGLPPLRPVIYHALAQRDSFANLALIYGARTPRDLLFRAELERWRGRFDFDVQVTVDRDEPDWHGNVGVVTTLVQHARVDPAQAIAMICGPEVMMRFTIRELEKVGMTDERIFISMERNMACGLGWCGHCQFGPTLVCRDGPVYRYDLISRFLDVKEL